SFGVVAEHDVEVAPRARVVEVDLSLELLRRLAEDQPAQEAYARLLLAGCVHVAERLDRAAHLAQGPRAQLERLGIVGGPAERVRDRLDRGGVVLEPDERLSE